MEMHPYTLIVALRCPFSISSDHFGSSLEQNKSSKKLVFVSTGCSLSFILLEISSFLSCYSLMHLWREGAMYECPQP